MSDQQIHNGFERLSGALAPPADTLARVDQRVRTRRRRRRTAVGGAAVLALAVVGGGALALTGGSDDSSEVPVAVDTPAPVPTLSITRPDGTSVSFTSDQLDLRCRDGRLQLSSARALDESRNALTQPFFYVEVVPARADGRTFTLPFESQSGSTEDRPLTVFLADTGRDGNEVSSAEPGAAGTVDVVRAACDPTPVLELEIDGALGSEVEQEPFTIQGAYR